MASRLPDPGLAERVRQDGGMSKLRLWGLAGLATVLLAASCTSGSDGAADDSSEPSKPDRGAGFVDETWFTGRQEDFLTYATATPQTGSPLNLMSQFERAARDKTYKVDAKNITVDDFNAIFKKIDDYEDTSDFDLLYLMNLWYADKDKLPTDVKDAIEQRFIHFKYWYTDPTPKGVIDQKWYWSENHQAIFHTLELLAGQAFPTYKFTVDGKTGAWHEARAKKLLDAWFDQKARFGFSEWHSDVYYQKDIDPLLTLAEYAKDPKVVEQASSILDLVLLDIALHLQKGDFGATHGRSYMKDKSISTDEDTFGLSKLLFDDTPDPYQGTDDAGATLFAVSKKYRMPEAIRRIATSDAEMVDKERMGVPLDASAPVSDHPKEPYGFGFGEDNVPFWWDRGALTVWQEVPTTIAVADKYNLWDTDFFKPFLPFKELGKDTKNLQQLAHDLAPQISFGLLSEVNTYTWRNANAMLSTAQSYRPGYRGEQYHSWQATLDGKALVFTQSPGNEPKTGDKWVDGDKYWTGEAFMPRSAQHGRVSMNLYAPGYKPADKGSILESFTYLPMTHAWFPSERFDEVVRAGNWTFGRKGDSYVALYSWRPVDWVQHDPTQVPTGGLTKDFDLVANGGADNVWIAEVGDKTASGSFADFQAKISAAPMTVTPRPVTKDGLPGGFDVAYTSPSEGALTFSQTGDLTVDGKPESISNYPRYDNPWVKQPFGDRTTKVSIDGKTLTLDTKNWTRTTSG
jgi:hypothetical protein